MPAFRGRLWFCSNFYPTPVEYEGFTFPTAEHAFCWAKCSQPSDKALVLMARTAADAKRIAKGAWCDIAWHHTRLRVMEEILRAKFRNPDCAEQLLATGDELLVEHNEWHDTFWGVCDGIGDNHLGKLLMKIRAELR